ncbi:MAG: 50S ribosomal protein L2 [Candidatus Niyogibacteria bacterium]|nr:50S ribosomal protein L2 [Candidatus Niyogibacteria bacterium]
MKKHKPTSPGSRGMTSILYRDVLTSPEPYKPLTKGRKRAHGRGGGRITVRHKGGGSKRLWRDVDFCYDKIGIAGRITSIEYDPNRTSFIALVRYADGEYRYHIVPEGMRVGNEMKTDKKQEPDLGARMPLSLIPVGISVYNIETYPGSGARLVRSAGNTAEVMAHDAGYALIKLPSGAIRKILGGCWASVGQVSNSEHGLITIGKAGRNRRKGIRPTVRGSAMNPVDHPYGGGEGRALRGTRRPKNKWGKGTRGVKTRKKKKYSNALVVQRRKKKK